MQGDVATLRERRYALGYNRRGRVSRSLPKSCAKSPDFWGAALRGLGYHHCSLRNSPAHACKGILVVDHDHYCSAGHVARKSACRECVRGFLCAAGNTQMSAWDLEYQARGTRHLPPEVADYIEGRPLSLRRGL